MGHHFDAYIDALVKEICTCPELNGADISTIFIGGGTPSVLDLAHIEKIMSALSRYKIATDVEITIEANPNSLTKTKLCGYRTLGINRLSIGLQAYQDNLLNLMGRPHTASDFLTCIDHATAAGFSNISADLIFALPGQSLADWEESLLAAVSANTNHISCYGLIIEEGTPFFDTYEPIDDDIDRRMYYMAMELLDLHGFSQYEISNFAKNGFKSRHNLAYWERKNYIGLGLSAHSLYNNTRFENTADLASYIEGRHHRQSIIKLSSKDIMSEFMFLGLRMTEGISISGFFKEFGVNIHEVYKDVTDKNVADKLLEINNDMIKLTRIGVDLSNVVLSEFLID